MKRFLKFIVPGLLIGQFVLPSYLWANACQSTGTANWNLAGTWTNCGGTVPQAADTFQVMDNHVVTLDVNASVAGGIVGSASVGAVLVLGQNYQLATTEDLECRYNATIKWQSGGDLNVASAKNLRLGRCALASDTTNPPTASAPGKVTGAGGIATSAQSGDTTPKQQIGTSSNPLQYISFQNTGTILLSAYGSTGTLTNGIYLAHDVFAGNGAITIGQGGATPLATGISITYSDFAETGVLLLNGAPGDAVGIRLFRHNTIYNTTRPALQIAGTDGWTMDQNIFKNQTPNGTHTAGGIIFTDNLVYKTGGSDGEKVLYHPDNEDGWNISNNYVFTDYNNPHQAGGGDTASPGAGPTSFIGNIWEINSASNSNPLDFICTYNRVAQRNIFLVPLGMDGAMTIMGSTRTPTITFSRNTVYSSTSYPTVSGAFVLGETGVSPNFVIDVVNNLAYSTTTANYANYNRAASTQPLNYVGYNYYYNFTTLWSGVPATPWTWVSGPTGEQTGIDPKFLDNTRTLAKWNARFGSGTESVTDALTYLHAINGYRGTPNFDQGGTVSVNNISSAVEWVKYGFSPTNTVLREAGDASYAVDGSHTIGAELWQNPRRKRAM